VPSYNQYQRSAADARFEDYTLEDGMIAWIDLLGVRSASHQEIVQAVRQVLLVAAEFSATGPIVGGTMHGTPQSALQYALVGDALILVEKNQPNTPAASKLALIWRVSELSARLFDLGYVHRGAITFGPVECFKDDGVNVITGKGVVRAAGLEASIKCTGLFFDEKCLPILETRQKQLAKQAKVFFKKEFSKCFWFFSARCMSGVLVASDGGLDSWMSALGRAKSHKYISRSNKLVKVICKVLKLS
jgi:hypothetical protein